MAPMVPVSPGMGLKISAKKMCRGGFWKIFFRENFTTDEFFQKVNGTFGKG